MNLIILFESDFIDDTHQHALFCGRRREHIISVFKAEIGKSLIVGLLNGSTGTGIIEKIGSSEIEMSVTLNESPPPPLPVKLIMALPRPKSLKKAIEAASSLGIKEIYLIESWRVEKSFWSSPVLSKESLDEHLILGLEQARDTIKPSISIKRRFKPFIEDEVSSIIKGTQAFVAHPYDAQPCPFALNTPLTLAIGPEGGFVPYEIELFKKYGFKPVSLGTRIFRVENAIPFLIGRIF
jgi:16S rRNA (uracil1498-N3)-methyltransferase